MEGDYVLVEKTDRARNGEIVVVLVDGAESTLKRCYYEPDNKIRLQPAGVHETFSKTFFKHSDLSDSDRCRHRLRQGNLADPAGVEPVCAPGRERSRDAGHALEAESAIRRSTSSCGRRFSRPAARRSPSRRSTRVYSKPPDAFSRCRRNSRQRPRRALRPRLPLLRLHGRRRHLLSQQHQHESFQVHQGGADRLTGLVKGQVGSEAWERRG